MTAGRGIVHSERTPAGAAHAGSKLFGIQSWVALSAKDEETTPDFVHYDAGEMPVLRVTARRVRIIAGSLLGATLACADSARCSMPTSSLEAGATCRSIRTTMSGRSIPCRARSRSAGDVFGPGSSRLPARRPHHDPARGRCAVHDARAASRWMARASSGGTSCRRRKDRIEQAKADWKAARFDTVPGETEFIPLPEKSPSHG